MLAELVHHRLGHKYHWAVSDYLQRSARHIASQTDLEHALAVGRASVEMVLEGQHGVLAGIERLSDEPYRWAIRPVPLVQVANREKKMPEEFIRADGYGITDACRRYLAPLIAGQAYPDYSADGLPAYLHKDLQSCPQRLASPPV